MSELVTFDICKGNTGALTFLIDAYKLMPGYAESAFRKLRDANITGAKLYIIWNDCCNNDTYLAIDMIISEDIDTINYFINYENGRGLRYRPEIFPPKKKD
jgi:hypothetical protein